MTSTHTCLLCAVFAVLLISWTETDCRVRSSTSDTPSLGSLSALRALRVPWPSADNSRQLRTRAGAEGSAGVRFVYQPEHRLVLPELRKRRIKKRGPPTDVTPEVDCMVEGSPQGIGSQELADLEKQISEEAAQLLRLALLRKSQVDVAYKLPRMANLSLVLCDDAHIRAFNLQYRGKDAATDVLSFEMDDDMDYKIHLPMKLLGDLMISLDTAAAQAEERGYSLLDEVRVLLVHGLLHLLGYDHEKGQEESDRMATEERYLLAQMGWKGQGLITAAEAAALDEDDQTPGTQGTVASSSKNNEGSKNDTTTASKRSEKKASAGPWGGDGAGSLWQMMSGAGSQDDGSASTPPAAKKSRKSNGSTSKSSSSGGVAPQSNPAGNTVSAGSNKRTDVAFANVPSGIKHADQSHQATGKRPGSSHQAGDPGKQQKGKAQTSHSHASKAPSSIPRQPRVMALSLLDIMCNQNHSVTVSPRSFQQNQHVLPTPSPHPQRHFAVAAASHSYPPSNASYSNNIHSLTHHRGVVRSSMSGCASYTKRTHSTTSTLITHCTSSSSTSSTDASSASAFTQDVLTRQGRGPALSSNNVQLVALDFDGTLLDSNSRILPSSVAAIKEACRRGITVIAATGKARPAAMAAANAAGLAGNGLLVSDISPGIFLQGLAVHGSGGQQLSDAALPAEVVHEAFRYSMETGISLCAFQGDTCGTLQLTEDLRALHSVYYEPLSKQYQNVDELLSAASVRKLLFMAPPKQISGAVLPDWNQRLRGQSASTMQAVPNMLEIVPRGVNKWAGACLLLEHLGLQRQQFMAVGDGGNDFEMVANAGIGVAMGNAVPAVKAAASKVVASHDEGGIAEAFEMFLF